MIWLYARMWAIIKKNNVKWINTLKTVFLSSEFWFGILCQLNKLNISIGKINKVNLQGKSKAWITHLLTEMSSTSPLKWERNISWGFAVEKLKLSQDLLKSFTTVRRGGHWVSPGQPTTAQMNKSSGHYFLFFHPIPSFNRPSLQTKSCVWSLSQT